MPTRRKHNRFCHLLGLNKGIANDVNRDKDLPVKDVPPNKHRGFNHGTCTNLKYRRLGGVEAVACSVVHNVLDRIKSRQLTFLKERAMTWYPCKFIQNSTLIGTLDGKWWPRRKNSASQITAHVGLSISSPYRKRREIDNGFLLYVQYPQDCSLSVTS